MTLRFKISHKILTICLLVASVPLSGIFYQMYLNNLDQKAAMERSLQQTIDLLSSEIEHWSDKNIKNINLVASLDQVKNMNALEQVPILKAAKENLDWISLIFIMDKDGNAIARSDNKTLKNYSDREYVKQVLAGQEIGQQVLIGKVQPEPLHCFAIPIKDSEKSLAGILTQCSTLHTISQYIANLKIGKSGYAILVDNTNRLIAHGVNRRNLIGRLQDFSSHPALNGLSDDKVTTQFYESKKQAMITKTIAHGWRVIVQQDFDEAYAPYFRAKFNTIVIIILTICVTVILSLLFSFSISNPVRALTKIANDHSIGVFAETIPGEERTDEIGDLARSLSRLSNSVRIAIRRHREIKKHS